MADSPDRSASDSTDAYEGRFRAFTTVLESADHGPQLCYAVQESLPPQCGGPDVVGWDWSAIDHESASGTRWGSYVLVGTYDGTTFTLTEPAAVDDGTVPRPGGGDSDAMFDTPCPEPPGGWKPVDPARTTEATLQEAIRVAQTSEGYGSLWVDQRPEAPADPGSVPDNDPQRLVLNVTTTGDLAELEAAVRAVWGGSLCVSQAARDEASLLEVQQQIHEDADILGSAPDFRTGQLVVQMFVADPARQRTFDDRYGEGTVRIEGVLIPLD